MTDRSIDTSRAHRNWLGLAALVALGALARPSSAADKDRSVDVTCAWGRLSDGKGRLLRCLTRDEATRLRDAAPGPVALPVAVPVAASAGVPVAPATVPGAPSPPPPSSLALSGPPPVLPAVAPSVQPLAAKALAATPPTMAVAPAPIEPSLPAPAPVTPPAAESELTADVGPVVADEGALPDALKSLRKVKERYAECIDRNGGLTAERGEVELRFLVQGKGRAEGVSVKKRRGVGEAAAKCVADVVDRRYVGYPEAPAVGASVVVAITKKKR